VAETQNLSHQPSCSDHCQLIGLLFNACYGKDVWKWLVIFMMYFLSHCFEYSLFVLIHLRMSHVLFTKITKSLRSVPHRLEKHIYDYQNGLSRCGSQ